MSDLLAVGSAGVLAYQAALAVTGDNVANADTPGYARRSVRLETALSGNSGILQIVPIAGSGVRASAMERSGDPLKIASARVAEGDHSRLAARADWLQRIETSLTGAGLESALSGVFDAATDLAAAPTSQAARTLFLDRADSAATTYRRLGDSLSALAADIDSAVATTSTEVNAITAGLARVNEELRRTQAGVAPSLGLLDSRDSLLADLAARVRITVTEGTKGAAIVRLGNGPTGPLLVPEFGNAVAVEGRNGPAGPELLLDPTHRAEVVRLPLSGSMAGLIEAGRELAGLRTAIDASALRFADAVNSWHQSGTDLRGDPGEALFNTAGVAISSGLANAGSASLDAVLADGATPAPDGYRLIADAGGFTLARIDGTASVSGAGPLMLDGLEVRPGAGARTGDSWTLLPATGASTLQLRPLGPDRVAAAARFLADANPLNQGDARITAALDPSATAFAAPPPLTLLVTAPGTLDVIDPASGTVLASLAYVPGLPVAGDGFNFTISGAAAVGDSFRVLPSGAGSNDNSTMLALASVRALANPEGTLEASFTARISSLGARLAETDRLQASARAVRDDAARAADAVSGVDLDREAAELTRLQMAYRANAQVIAAARDMFDTMLGVSR